MRKFIFISLVVLILFPLAVLMMDNEELSAGSFEIIPDEAIRLRILANSDEEVDQQIKYFVRDIVSSQIEDWVGHMTDIEEARTYIQNNSQKLLHILETNFQQEEINQSIQLEYRSKVPFPMKLYDTVLYPAGDYEAILITLGSGKGSNWWCVLFPPLCFLDFNHGTTIAEDEREEEKEKVKIKFFLLDWLGLS